MPAVVTRASDHVVDEPLATYCDVADVRTILYGVEPDDASTELSAWLSQARADAVIGMYLEEKKVVVDDLCGRGFDQHEDVDVVVDGQGSPVLDLGILGFFPLLDLSALTVNSTEQDIANFVWYTDGTVKPASAAQVTFYNPMVRQSFPRGNQNIALTISWGYTAIPVRIKQAQAQLTAAEVLGHISRSNTETPGMLGGIQRVEFDEFRVTNFGRSRYSAAIERLEKLANVSCAQFKSISAISLSPGGYNNSGETRDMVFGRAGSQAIYDREQV